MYGTPIKLILALGLLVSLMGLPNSLAQTEDGGANFDHLLDLVEELHATVPWYYEFSEHSESKFNIPGELVNKVITRDLEKHFERGTAKSNLSSMGTKAWPVVPLLLLNVIHSENFERDQESQTSPLKPTDTLLQ